MVGFWNWTPFLIECEIETELSTRTTGRLLDHTSIYRGRGSNDHIHIKILYLTSRALTLYFSNLRNFYFQGVMTFVFVCGCGRIFVTRIVNVVLENLFALSEFTNFHQYLDYETVERDRFFRAYYTLLYNFKAQYPSQLQTSRPILHSHHTPTKLTSNHSNPWPKSMESFKSASREEVV